MATNTSMLHVRVDAELKAQASEILASMGLTMSDTVSMLLRRVVAEQAFPLDLKVPNAATRAAMIEARALMPSVAPASVKNQSSDNARISSPVLSYIVGVA